MSTESNSSRPAKSYADIRGEWEERKIPVAGAVKSFISHLKVGQDLTKVSLPSIFLRPYSMLEEFGSRSLGQFQLLTKATTQEKSLDRMLSVLEWFLSCTKDESFNHKPLNPILGETHVCKVENEGSTTYYFAEQISHHPPVTGFQIENVQLKISVTGAYSFNIIFRPNSLTVATAGRLQINIGDEAYILEKPYPDMLIKNTVLGKKSVAWVGKVSIHCPSTGWIVELNYDLNKDNVKVVDGSIMNLEKTKIAKGEPNTYYIGGKCGGIIYISQNELKYTSEHSENTKSDWGIGGVSTSLKQWWGGSQSAAPVLKDADEVPEGADVLVDLSKVPVQIPTYPNEDLLYPTSSQVIWKDLTPLIIAYDLEKADEVKRKIEDGQRAKRQQLETANEVFKPTYFEKDGKDIWHVKPEYSGNLASLFPVPK